MSFQSALRLKTNGKVLTLLSRTLKKMMRILSQGLSDKWIYLISWKNHRLGVFGPWSLLGRSHEEAWPPSHSPLPPTVSKLGFKKRNRPQTLSSLKLIYLSGLSVYLDSCVEDALGWIFMAWYPHPTPSTAVASELAPSVGFHQDSS